MSNVHDIAERLRREPFHIFSLRHNCIGKSVRFKMKCSNIRVRVKVVVAFGFVPCKRLMLPRYMPTFHCWGELNGERIELTRPLIVLSIWGTYDVEMRPLIAIRI